ncbi:MAG: nucleoside hydrolase [Aquabacterium sp.]
MISGPRRAVWLDADPGVDDWLAWLLLQVHPGLRLDGVSVVAGNAPLTRTLDNALRIRALHGLAVPVHGGAAQALDGSRITAADVLGPAGMRTTGQPLPPTAQPTDSDDAVTALLAWLGRGPPQPLLVVTGPMTHVALALQRDRAAFDALEDIVFMGGSTDRGNHTPAAEFNIAADPEAADIVLRSGLPLTMFGLDLCRQLPLTQDHVQEVRSWPGEPAAVLAGHLDAYQRIRSADGAQPMPLYDPAPALWLHAPELFSLQAAPVDVELIGRHTRGMTVCDLRNRQGRPCNVRIATAVEAPSAMALFMDQLRAALAV